LAVTQARLGWKHFDSQSLSGFDPYRCFRLKCVPLAYTNDPGCLAAGAFLLRRNLVASQSGSPDSEVFPRRRPINPGGDRLDARRCGARRREKARMAKTSRAKESKQRWVTLVVGPWMWHALGIFVLAAGIVGGVWAARQYVDKRVTFPTRAPVVVIKDRPVWMSDVLAEQIIRLAKPVGTRSVYDHQLLVDVTAALRTSPWVKEVRAVRRAFIDKPGDTIEIDADFRAPLAMVKWGDYLWLIDGEADKLPEQFKADQMMKIVAGRDGRTNIRVISGVQRPPPPTGEKWLGGDLSAGIEMTKILYGRRYADEIVQIDVSNYDGRRDAREAQVVLETKRGTQVRWGRVPSAKDAFVEIAPGRKLEYIEKVWEQYKQVDAGQPWIDIRFDRITYPAPPTVEEHAKSE